MSNNKVSLNRIRELRDLTLNENERYFLDKLLVSNKDGKVEISEDDFHQFQASKINNLDFSNGKNSWIKEKLFPDNMISSEGKDNLSSTSKETQESNANIPKLAEEKIITKEEINALLDTGIKATQDLINSDNKEWYGGNFNWLHKAYNSAHYHSQLRHEQEIERIIKIKEQLATDQITPRKALELYRKSLKETQATRIDIVAAPLKEGLIPGLPDPVPNGRIFVNTIFQQPFLKGPETLEETIDLLTKYATNEHKMFNRVNITCHGTPGALYFRHQTVGFPLSDSEKETFLKLKPYLTEDAELMIGACQFAADKEGKKALLELSELLGIRVIAGEFYQHAFIRETIGTKVIAENGQITVT